MKLRTHILLFFSGVAGGLTVLLALWWWMPQFVEPPEQHPASVLAVRQPLLATEGVVPSFVEASRKTLPSVVHIFCEYIPAKKRGSREYQAGSGSGVMYTTDGYIITNDHVVEFANQFEVTLMDKRRFEAKLVGSYPKADLAVLKIEADDLQTLEFGDSDEAEVGEWVLAVGNPLELTSTVTAGIISAKGRNLDIIDGQDAIESFIQTDAVVNPGNSGGALVDAQGHLLGINTAISSSTGFYQGHSFAIPSKLVKRVVDDIITYGYYRRPYLGVIIKEIEKEDIEELALDVTQGIRVLETEEDGSAAEAGMQKDDVIIRVNDQRIYSMADLQEVISESHVGDVLNIQFYRDGEKMDLEVKLKPGEEEEED